MSGQCGTDPSADEASGLYTISYYSSVHNRKDVYCLLAMHAVKG